MKELIITLSAFILFILATMGQTPMGSAWDIDGNSYPLVKIGDQVWMAKNLDVSHFRNGDIIPEARTAEEWQKASDDTSPAWCYYKNDPVNGKHLGKLYNWYAVNDPRGLAPAGYHIPTDYEWVQLIDYLGGMKDAGYKMKSTNGGWWEFGEEGNGNNESGFNALSGGWRSIQGEFDFLESDGCFWTSTTFNKYSYWDAWNYTINGGGDDVHKFHNDEGEGSSVRCIKN